MKRNVPLKRTGFAPKPRKQMRRTPIKKVSAKRAKEQKVYAKLRKEFLSREQNKWCPVVSLMAEGSMIGRFLPFLSWQARTTEIHHIDGREGSLYLDTSKWLAVSHDGHRWIHANVAEARKRGWIR